MFMMCYFSDLLVYMHNAGCAGCKSFLDNNIASVVIGLKVTNQSFAHLVSFSKSEFKLKFLLQRGDFLLLRINWCHRQRV